MKTHYLFSIIISLLLSSVSAILMIEAVNENEMKLYSLFFAVLVIASITVFYSLFKLKNEYRKEKVK